jgi:hypothetical protein
MIDGLARSHFNISIKEAIYTSLSGSSQLIQVKREDFVKLIEQGIKLYERDVKPMEFIILQEQIELIKASTFLNSLFNHII